MENGVRPKSRYMDKHTRLFKFRLTPQEYEALEQLAQKLDTNRSDAIRYLIANATETMGVA